MGLGRTLCAALVGLDGHVVEVEAHAGALAEALTPEEHEAVRPHVARQLEPTA